MESVRDARKPGNLYYIPDADGHETMPHPWAVTTDPMANPKDPMADPKDGPVADAKDGPMLMRMASARPQKEQPEPPLVRPGVCGGVARFAAAPHSRARSVSCRVGVLAVA